MSSLADEKSAEDLQQMEETPEAAVGGDDAPSEISTALPRPYWVPVPPDSYKFREGDLAYAQLRPDNVPLPKPGGGLKSALPRPGNVPLPPDSHKYRDDHVYAQVRPSHVPLPLGAELKVERASENRINKTAGALTANTQHKGGLGKPPLGKY